MRKITVFNLISVDGYFAGSDGNIDWHNVDDEFNKFAVEQTQKFGNGNVLLSYQPVKKISYVQEHQDSI